jgi:hypothetical protein
MADLADIVEAMRATPANVRFRDAVKVATRYFGEPRQSATSHSVWKMPWAGDPRVNLQRGSNGMAKAYQIKQLLAALDRLASTEQKE